MKKVCILGLGYIGLPTAVSFARNGFDVVAVDIHQKVIEILNHGKIHIEEPGLNTIVQEAFHTGKLRVASKPEYADAYVIAVPTPLGNNKIANMEAVKAATVAIAHYLRQGNLVILESTSPPGTTIDLVKPILEKKGLLAGSDLLLAYSPERVLPGQILREFIENPRVIGGIDQTSAKAGRDLYKSFVIGEIVMTDSTTAEMVKLMENTFRDVNIAIANEFSRLTDHFGVNI